MAGSLAEGVKKFDIKHKISGVRIGTLIELTKEGQVIVDYPGNLFGPITASFTVSMGLRLKKCFASGDCKILLTFEEDDPQLPIIIDAVRSTLNEISEEDTVAVKINKAKDVFIEGMRFSFEAKEEIVLRSGKSSITLTKSGKVIIRGAYILNRSSGVNRIKGGSVQIN